MTKIRCNICKDSVFSFQLAGGKCRTCSRRIKEKICIKCGNKGLPLTLYKCQPCHANEKNVVGECTLAMPTQVFSFSKKFGAAKKVLKRPIGPECVILNRFRAMANNTLKLPSETPLVRPLPLATPAQVSSSCKKVGAAQKVLKKPIGPKAATLKLQSKNTLDRKS